MRIKLSAPPVYFMHVPRTAGTSLHQFLRLIYPENRILSLGIPWQFEAIELAQLKNFDCYQCHFGPNLYKLVGRPDLPCITTLRDPVERFISTMYFRQWHVREHPHLFAQEYIDLMAPFLNADLRTMLAIPEIANIGRDEQTRTLGQDDLWDLRPLFKDGTAESSQRLLSEARLPVPTSKPEMERVAANARQHLERMAVVGLTEQLDESMELIADLLGVHPPPRAVETNIGFRKTGVDRHGYRSTTPPDVIEQVEELTTYDRELYAYARALFEQQHARYRARPRRTYSIAPRFLMPARRTALASLTRLQATHPTMAESRLVRWIRSRGRRVL